MGASTPRKKANAAATKNTEEKPKKSSFQKFVIRSISGIALLAAFLLAVSYSHIAVALTIIFCGLAMYYEIVRIGYEWNKEKNLPYFRILYLYFLLVVGFYFYGQDFVTLNPDLLTTNIGSLILKYHQFATYAMYCAGLVWFVLLLKRGMLRYQFGQLAWIHLSFLMTIGTSHVIASHIFNGMVWFLFPALLVIANDSFAYFFGKTFGRTRLIKLSPNKTWEGFIGAMFSTFFLAIVMSSYVPQMPWFYCPSRPLDFPTSLECGLPDAFVRHDTLIDFNIIGLDVVTSLEVSNFDVFAVTAALFVSIVAPFGGFFASGLKRAYNLDDFGDTIPGHGGVTDRMDCQLLVGLFSALYHSAFVATGVSVAAAMKAVALLSTVKQKEIFVYLCNLLADKGEVAAEVCSKLF